MNRADILLAVAIAAVVACAAFIAINDSDDTDGEISSTDGGFTFRLFGVKGDPPIKDLRIPFSSFGPDQTRDYYLEDFDMIKPPEGMVLEGLMVERLPYDFHHLHVMTGAKKMVNKGGDVYEWEKNHSLYHKVNGKDVYYSMKADRLDLVVFRNTTVNIHLSWVTPL